MTTIHHPSAKSRLDPIAEAFALPVDQHVSCSIYQQISPSADLVAQHLRTIAGRLIPSSIASRRRDTIQIPIAL